MDKEEAITLQDYIQGLSMNRSNGSVCYNWLWARPRTCARWHILQHIVNHSTHHRGEIGNYLAIFGQSPKDLESIKFVTRTSE